MAVDVMIHDGRLSRWAASLLVVGTCLIATVEARGQEAEDGTAQGRAVIGVGDQGIETVLRRVIERQDQLEAALRSLEERINVIAETTETTAARISRGDDPLVALEIEQLWALIDTLERDNAILNERLDAIAASEGGPAETPATPSGE